jgi:hypothetical protein
MNEKVLRTATGKEFDILWDGVSTIDFTLRFAVVNSDIATIFKAFSDPSETATLTRIWDGIESVYTGYTIFRGVDMAPDGEIVVSLNPEG